MILNTVKPNDILHRSSRALILSGLAATLLFAGTVGVWAVKSKLSGAVVAQGEVVVNGAVKKIQHHTGGIVGALMVREGDHVEADQILVHLDDTAPRANLQIIEKQLDELSLRSLRLAAERDHATGINLPLEIEYRLGEPEFSALFATETNLFNARRAAVNGQLEQLLKQVEQLEEQIAGVEAQDAARARQDRSVGQELSATTLLFDQGLVTLSRKATLDRAIATLDGQKGQFAAAIAQARGKIAEIRLEVIKFEEIRREDILNDLSEARSKSSELLERRTAAKEELRRMDLRSPITGRVQQLAVHASGSVISPAEPVMLIVPSDEALEIEAQVRPADIDQIKIGAIAEVKLHAFNQRNTPKIEGRVERISADTIKDKDGGASYYIVRVVWPASELERVAPSGVTAGMQADVFVRTEDRTPLEFFLKPVIDQFDRAFRER